MATAMLGIAFGIIYMFEFGISPIHLSFVLMIGAISFIMGSAFFNSRGADQLKSLIGGGVIGISSTFVIVSIAGSLRYASAIYGTNDGPSWEMLVSMLAVCMVASMIILEFVLHRLRD
ncbi:MAG: heat-shock protein [Methanocellales archaeon]|nr:heat-shock protein [Methanocellales archaeon]